MQLHDVCIQHSTKIKQQKRIFCCIAHLMRVSCSKTAFYFRWNFKKRWRKVNTVLRAILQNFLFGMLRKLRTQFVL